MGMGGSFADAVLSWYDRCGRKLPFRGTKDPYRIWLSEIMLQQTRTEQMSEYYGRFLSRFPTVEALAEASEGEVLKYWEGLGYYSRARNLLKAARCVVNDHGGRFPADAALLRRLPGVGPYTAAAVASIAFSLPEPAIDGNLTRVLSRARGIREDVSLPSVKRQLEQTARELISRERPGDFNQALMDLGAGICVPGTPDCASCPLMPQCSAYKEGDQEALPVQPRKVPPRPVHLNVLLIFSEGRVYMKAREEALLKGMYVYCLSEKAPSAVLRGLRVEGAAAPAGQARHVFTHRVWEMKLYTCMASAVPAKLKPHFYTRTEMNALPVPAAMRAAKALAEQILLEGGNA